MLATWVLLSSLATSNHALQNPEPLPERALAGAPEFSPPDEIADCYRRLELLGVSFRQTALPVHQKKGSTIQCGAPQAVRYDHGPQGMKLHRAPVLSCPMALAMVRFEALAQAWVLRYLKQKVVRVRHAGSYNCREMRNYPGWVSEHSYANALDLKSFELADGKVLTVKDDYARPGPKGQFFRALAKSLVEKKVFSVVLTPNFDGLHKRHLHLDLARYRVDGT